MIFSAEELGYAAKRRGLPFPEHVLDQLVADAGKHVGPTGPPGLRHRDGQLRAGPVRYHHLDGLFVGSRHVETIDSATAAVGALSGSG
jgi:hypothetical protein